MIEDLGHSSSSGEHPREVLAEPDGSAILLQPVDVYSLECFCEINKERRLERPFFRQKSLRQEVIELRILDKPNKALCPMQDRRKPVKGMRKTTLSINLSKTRSMLSGLQLSGNIWQLPYIPLLWLLGSRLAVVLE